MEQKAGTCNFKLTQEFDQELNAIKAVGAHNCKYYGVNLVVFYLTTDYKDKISRHFKVVDEDTSEIISENEEKGCKQLNSHYTACQYYLSPTNQRFGVMLDYPSRGLLTYQARWQRA